MAVRRVVGEFPGGLTVALVGFPLWAAAVLLADRRLDGGVGPDVLH